MLFDFGFLFSLFQATIITIVAHVVIIGFLMLVAHLNHVLKG